MILQKLKNFGRWLLELIAGHILLQLLFSPTPAYFVGLALWAPSESKIVFNTLPPLFWPIFAGIWGLITGYHGFVVPGIEAWRAKQEKRRKEEWQRKNSFSIAVESAITKITAAKDSYNKSLNYAAQSAVDKLYPALADKYGRHNLPVMIDMSSYASVKGWLEGLRGVLIGEKNPFNQDFDDDIPF